MFNKAINYELDDKVDKFIEWYEKNMVTCNYTNIGEFDMPRKLRNFIEKMAVWYELRFPEYEVNRLMPGSNQELKNVSEEMFYSNNYMKEILFDSNNKKNINWSDFYNYKSFINSLPSDESCFLEDPPYNSLIYFNIRNREVHIHLDPDGKINEADGIGIATNFKLKDEELEGRHIQQLIFLLEKLVKLPRNKKLDSAIKRYEREKLFKKKLLNCVMYRIIERGGNRIGPRRGLLFAKEFGTNIDIPMIYGVDMSDPGLDEFIGEYLKAGGKKDLVCLIGYGSRNKKNQILSTITIEKILMNSWEYYLVGTDPRSDEKCELLRNLLHFDSDEKSDIKQKVKKI